jgi:hypothetical protein
MDGSIQLHSQEFHNVCDSTNIVRVVSSKMMSWAGMEGENHLGNLNIDRIILKWS